MFHFAMSSIAEVEARGLEKGLIVPDRVYLEQFEVGGKRYREGAAWRSFLRSELQKIGLDEDAKCTIEYDCVGAPRLIGSLLHFSVSHTSTHVAIVVSDRQCAVDIEALARNFARVKGRYISSDEAQLESGDTPLLPLIWSAKETLYKISGGEGLDLINDLKIKQISPDSDTLIGTIAPQQRTIKMRYTTIDNHIVVYSDSD